MVRKLQNFVAAIDIVLASVVVVLMVTSKYRADTKELMAGLAIVFLCIANAVLLLRTDTKSSIFNLWPFIFIKRKTLEEMIKIESLSRE